LGALVLGHHALHLGQQFALWAIAERVLQKDQRGVELVKLLHQQPLMGVVPSQPIGRQHHHGVDFAAPRGIPQAIEGRAVQPAAAAAVIAKLMLRQQAPGILLDMLSSPIGSV
jgi:hypothetical protein